jgi:hypothetical protein
VAVSVILIYLLCICFGFWLFSALAIPIWCFFFGFFFYCFDRLTRRFGILYIGFFGFGFCLLGLPCGASSLAFPVVLGELMWFYFAGKANH